MVRSGGIRRRDSGGAMARRCNRGIGVKLVGNGAASGAAGLDESRSVIRHARRRRRRSGAPHCIFGATAAAAYHCITNALFFPSAFLSSFSISLAPSYSNLPTSFFPYPFSLLISFCTFLHPLFQERVLREFLFSTFLLSLYLAAGLLPTYLSIADA